MVLKPRGKLINERERERNEDGVGEVRFYFKIGFTFTRVESLTSALVMSFLVIEMIFDILPSSRVVLV